jgi:phosphoglycerol transferase MdoB-like AlkP superfamily enzyme
MKINKMKPNKTQSLILWIYPLVVYVLAKMFSYSLKWYETSLTILIHAIGLYFVNVNFAKGEKNE